MGDFFVSSLSGASARQAVIEETGPSAWLYMSAPDGAEPIAACFLYNTGRDGDGPPPLEPDLASEYRIRMPVTEDDVAIVWSPKGDAVAARIHGEFVGFIAPDDLLGFSRSVREDCDWAHPFDVARFLSSFPTSQSSMES